MIGAKSTIKGRVPNNVIATGLPIKIIKKNIAWGHHSMVGFEDFFEQFKTEKTVIDYTKE